MSQLLVCGDPADEPHREGCPLGRAENVALNALTEAANQGSTPLGALRDALAALVDAGLDGTTVHNATAMDLWEITTGLLDDLWDTGLIKGSDQTEHQAAGGAR